MKCFPPRSHRSRVRRQKLSIPLPAINSRTKSKVTRNWSLDTLCDVRGGEGGGKGLKKPRCRYLEQLSISSQSEEREIPHKPMRIKVKISWLLKARENWTRVTKSQLVLVLNLIGEEDGPITERRKVNQYNPWLLLTLRGKVVKNVSLVRE